jgi:phage tail-like protein
LRIRRRSDPYKNFTFRVKWDGRYVAGVNKVSALKRTIEVVTRVAGGEPGPSRKFPGRGEYEAITLERGVTHDTEFETWAKAVWDQTTGAGSSGDFRKDVVIDVFSKAGRLVLSYKVRRCWVSEYQAIAGLEAKAKAVLIETITLENEGWERAEAGPGRSA